VTGIFKIFLIPFAGIFFLCSLGPSTVSSGGGGIETVALSGKIVDTLGRPALSTQVVLLPATYNPAIDTPISHAQICTTDAQGNYRLSAPDSGQFNIAAVRSQDLSRLLIRNIRVGNDSVFVHVDTLRMPGTIRIRIPAGLDETNGYFYVPGTTIYSWLRDKNGYILLNPVPACVNLTVLYAIMGSSAKPPPQVIADSVMVVPGGITTIEYIGWVFSKKLALNTTATGANVAGTVTNFPLLVRLTSSNFDFFRAKSGGEDLRFAKSNGSPLPYEIERWDSAGSLAEIWVRVDTVYGNDSTHYIVMMWGNPDAGDSSNSAKVFDTSSGLAGAWHLGEKGNSNPGGYKDATGNNNNLTGSSRMASAAVDGMIGRAQTFSGDSTYILGPAPRKINGNVSFTVSFWLSFSPAAVRSWILCFGGDNGATELCHFLINPNDSTQFGLSGGPGIQPSQVQNIFDVSSYRGKWSFVTTVYNTPDTSLATYINGVLMDKRTVLPANIIASGGLCISRNPATMASDDGLYGMLDELRLYSTAVSIDWIRLSYMNQKADNALVNVR
jgi:hypothetical protein